ncbi:hypothetical protein M422DRAFT_783906 [Sphaerobolus stellatus SS14]|uniref:Polyketide synthase phosphopantetheine-binding domain-containing protein n=1 Tax=Sphaerobolus stellatus (strain SS14) TaxID=990650 RepID=A0A0C9U8G4_SPHS4|nr:hypothetical protein M422DRAFT_783906 [Sphaerobolus stellatus SS14]
MSTQHKFTLVPVRKELTLDGVYDWHREHSTNVAAFTYPDEDNKQQFITWGELGTGIDSGVEIIHFHIPETLKGNKPASEPIVVGILSSADPLTYTTFMFAHLRLTRSMAGQPLLPFLISSQNSPLALVHLITAQKVKYLWVNNDQMKNLANEAVKHLELEQGSIPSILPFPTFMDLYVARDIFFNYTYDSMISYSMDSPALILHSSGILFPFFLDDFNGMGQINQTEIVAVHNSPLSHAMGVLAAGWAAFSGYVCAVHCPYGAKTPSDPERFLQEIENSHSTAVISVPSFVEAWAADLNSVERLKKLKAIYWGGGPLSERTGRFLIQEGVNIALIYGATEVGLIAKVAAKPHAEGCERFRFTSNLSPILLPDPKGPDTFELVLKESETHHLSAINTEINEVRAYASSDLVQQHADDPTLFRIKGRKDDQIMLITGEKTNPGPMEHIIMKNPYVKSPLIFGRGKPSSGVLIEPKFCDEAEQLGLEIFRNLLWPNINEANDYAPAHSRIFKEMILVASRSRPFLYTAKDTAPKGDYQGAVDDSTQTDIPIPVEITKSGGWSLEDTLAVTATYIRNTLLHGLRQVAPTSTVQKITSNFVYQQPTVDALFQFVANASQQKDTDIQGDLEVDRKRHLQNLVHKYTQNWPVHKPAQPPIEAESEVVLLTGSTGGLGSQILAQLVTLSSVTRIYAFNRPSKKASHQRHIKAFTDRGNLLSLLNFEKIVYIEGDTAVEGFSIEPELFHKALTIIIHNAWRVDFNLSLASFEPAIRGVRYMVDLALGPLHATPPRVMFTSRVGNVKSWSNIPPVSEGSFSDLDLISSSGYIESKWVSEQILEAAYHNTELEPVIIRVGQLSGGLNGDWNVREWFPSLVRARQVVGGAPDNEGLVSFVPVYVAAAAIIDMRISSSIFAHLVHPRPVTWRNAIGIIAGILDVPIIPFDEWLRRLEAVPRTSEALHNNPALHLLDFYHVSAPPKDMAGQEEREAMGWPATRQHRLWQTLLL